MELRPGFVIGSGILSVKGNADCGGELPADLGVEPCHGGSRVERPTMQRDVGDAIFAPRADRHVNKRLKVPVPVALMPADQSIESRVTEISRTLVEMEAAVHFKCPVEQRQGQSGESIDVDINGLPTKRQDDANSYITAQYLLRCNPEQQRRGDFAVSVEIYIRVDCEPTRWRVGVDQAAEGNAFGSIATGAAGVEIIYVGEVHPGRRRIARHLGLETENIEIRGIFRGVCVDGHHRTDSGQ